MYKGKRILAIIPARGGSKGIPRKNLQIVEQETLLARTIRIARYSRLLDKIIVSSEDAEILAEAKQTGAVPFIRPVELASDTAPAWQAVVHAIENLPDYDYIVLLQVTTPLREKEDIDGCIRFCLDHKAPCCVSMAEAENNPFWMFNLNADKALQPIIKGEIPLRRQDLPPVYVLNGAVYVADAKWFLTRKSFLEAETIGYVMDPTKSLDIDTPFDLELLKLYLQQQALQAKLAIDTPADLSVEHDL
jgi:CMP-N,N'-diacetyllegionaminic acid synthase